MHHSNQSIDHHQSSSVAVARWRQQSSSDNHNLVNNLNYNTIGQQHKLIMPKLISGLVVTLMLNCLWPVQSAMCDTSTASGAHLNVDIPSTGDKLYNHFYEMEAADQLAAATGQMLPTGGASDNNKLHHTTTTTSTTTSSGNNRLAQMAATYWPLVVSSYLDDLTRASGGNQRHYATANNIDTKFQPISGDNSDSLVADLAAAAAAEEPAGANDAAAGDSSNLASGSGDNRNKQQLSALIQAMKAHLMRLLTEKKLLDNSQLWDEREMGPKAQFDAWLSSGSGVSDDYDQMESGASDGYKKKRQDSRELLLMNALNHHNYQLQRQQRQRHLQTRAGDFKIKPLIANYFDLFRSSKSTQLPLESRDWIIKQPKFQSMSGPLGRTSNSIQTRSYTGSSVSDNMGKRIENTRWNKLRGMWGKRSSWAPEVEATFQRGNLPAQLGGDTTQVVDPAAAAAAATTKTTIVAAAASSDPNVEHDKQQSGDINKEYFVMQPSNGGVKLSLR